MKPIFMEKKREGVRDISYKYLGGNGKLYVNKNNPDSHVWPPDRLQELCNYTRNITGHWSLRH